MNYDEIDFDVQCHGREIALLRRRCNWFGWQITILFALIAVLSISAAIHISRDLKTAHGDTVQSLPHE